MRYGPLVSAWCGSGTNHKQETDDTICGSGRNTRLRAKSNNLGTWKSIVDGISGTVKMLSDVAKNNTIILANMKTL